MFSGKLSAYFFEDISIVFRDYQNDLIMRN